MILAFMVSLSLLFVAFAGAIYLMHSAKARSRLADNQGKVVALFMIIVVVGVVLIFSSYNGIIRAPLQAVGLMNEEVNCITDRTRCFYGIVFDAGSTGSRIHVYKFQRTGDAKNPYGLVDELFLQNKQGLSSFAKDPQKGADSLRPFMEQAKLYIPEVRWKETPIELKATAGLRLLDKQDSEALLQGVMALFKSSPFHMYENPVAIMEGDDEGIFSWYTLNFLKGTMGDKNNMLGILDLGGGSTQITFVPRLVETVQNAAEGYLIKKDVQGAKVDLYTHSYLGLGLMSGRFQTVGGIEDPESNDEVNPDSFTSSCFSESFSDTMKYNGKQYRISGAATQQSRYEECYAAAKAFLPKYKVQQVAEINQLEFVTISYYYDRAVESGLIDEQLGGVVAVRRFVEAGMKACSSGSADMPYLCLDLSYITALMKEGFGFRDDTQVLLRKKINDIEITWGLGAIIDIFNTYGIPKS